MTDNEIIKALECCTKDDDNKCYECPYDREYYYECKLNVMKETLNLINRKDAEIERLQTVKKHINNLILRDCDYVTAEAYNEAFIKALERLHDNVNAKSEAIKEFWSKLKAKATTSTDSPYRMHKKEIKISDGDNLVKEMVGGD